LSTDIYMSHSTEAKLVKAFSTFCSLLVKTKLFLFFLHIASRTCERQLLRGKKCNGNQYHDLPTWI